MISALRTRPVKRRYRLEQIADGIFLPALDLMVIVATLVAVEFL